ncbi:MAG: biliverdin-producing heme oxygenase [Cyanobacteriota bacterium]
MAASSLSKHAQHAEANQRPQIGPRLRKLHSRIGRAHHHAEGMAFSRALLEEKVSPIQLAALLRSLAPAYALIEMEAPRLARQLGVNDTPWSALARSAALEHDLALLNVTSETPACPAAKRWLERLHHLAQTSPHRLMAHLYVRYGGDLSGGQLLAPHANAILQRKGLPALSFWVFEHPEKLKQALHDTFERFVLSTTQEAELIDEVEEAFRATQGLLADLEAVRLEEPGAADKDPNDPGRSH